MATVDELVEVVAQVAQAVNTLEAKVTEALKNSGIPPETQAKIDQAVADLKASVADAADNVDEAAQV
jgi:molecular chaperone DnaK (HSP70)